MNESKLARRVFAVGRAVVMAGAGVGVVAGCSLMGDDEVSSSSGQELAGEYSIFNDTDTPQVASDSDSAAVELGVRFRADSAGTITGIRFLKSQANTGTHVGHLWSNTGTLLGTVTFTSETASGWQTARFSSPVTVQAGVTYIASYHTDTGHYAATNNAFGAAALDRPPLHALRDNQDGRNGVYRYGASAFPNQTYSATNYFVDVLFRPNGADADGGAPPPSCSGTTIASVTASGNDGNVPANVLDNDFGTRWSNLGKGSWIQADLGSSKSLCSVAIAWYNGNQRRSSYVVQTSTNGTTFTTVASGQSAGNTTALETVSFSATSARYVRVVVNGNTSNDWASITELRASAGSSSGAADAGAPTDAGAGDAGSSDGGSDPGPLPPATCNLNATTATFASQVAALPAGQTLCLAAGSYGTWNGVQKSGVVRIRPQEGATVTMSLNFNGARNLLIEGMTIPSSRMVNTTRDITLARNKFTGFAVFDGVANSNIVLDANTHVGINTCEGCFAGRVQLPYGSNTHSGITVKNSLFADGNADGIQAGTGLDIINNEFRNIHENGPNDTAHTDAIQLLGAKGTLVKGNWIHHCADGIVAYDGIDSAIIEDNVLDIANGRYGIELYSDRNSIVRHNTLKYATTCSYLPCGQIMLDHKSQDPAGTGTIIVDNIASAISLSNGSTAAMNTGNMLRSGASGGNFAGTPTYVGGAAPTTIAGFKLATGSPGKNAASDGLDVGIR